MQNIIGQTIANRYRVDQFLGRGGMAEVYKVWDQRRATFLAMKLLHEDLALDRVFINRFKREGQTLAKLQHPNIVRFYGLVQDGRLAFMLLDYVEGETLKHKIFDAEGPMYFPDIREVSRAVCSALQFAHSESLIHCDIKPANIMINQHGTVLLSDFGIARMKDAATATMIGVGTPAYMAPEQAKGLNPIPQSDIYSLGIVLYEMLTGERPFIGDQAQITGTSSDLVRWEQINLDPPPPSTSNPAISPELDRVIVKCLAKEPSHRYLSPLSLSNDLEKGLISPSQSRAGKREAQKEYSPQQFNVGSVPKSQVDSRLKKTPGWKLPIMLLVGAAIIFGMWRLISAPDTHTGRTSGLVIPEEKTSTTVIISTSDSVEESSQTENKTQPTNETNQVFDSPDVYYPLAGCAGSRTRVGDSIFISFDGRWNALREDPDIGADDNIIGRAEEGEVLQVVGGPKCSLGWILWRVETETMKKAWTPESDGEEFWFEIIDSRKVCSGFPETRLHIGDYGHVAVKPSEANHVRVDPYNGAAILGKIQPGEQFQVLDGPECASGWIWTGWCRTLNIMAAR